MVVIRMARGGAKKKPFYSIVVTDSRKRRDSGYIERIGYFNPVAKGSEIRLNLEEDKLIAWQNKGAKLSDRVKHLIKEFKNPAIREKSIAIKEAKLQIIKNKKDILKKEEESKKDTVTETTKEEIIKADKNTEKVENNNKEESPKEKIIDKSKVIKKENITKKAEDKTN